jgi:hypothetical protein
MKMYRKHVSPAAGRNPVARAVAQKAMRGAVLDQKIKLYLTDEGESCTDFCSVLGMTLSVMIYAAQLDPRVKPDDLQVRIVRGGLSACSQMAEADSFSRVNIPAVERALDTAVDLNARLSPDAVNGAWAVLTRQGFNL